MGSRCSVRRLPFGPAALMILAAALPESPGSLSAPRDAGGAPERYGPGELLCVSPRSCAFASQDESDVTRLLASQERLRTVIARAVPSFVFIGGGSGVCISRDGWILTNHHVAGPSGRAWTVHFAGGKKYSAKVVGHDPNGDLSLLKVQFKEGEAADLPFSELGDSDALKIGRPVFAVGNPFLLGNGKGAQQMPGAPSQDGGNWEPTVTLGVVSALHRFQDWYMDAIHTDCQINPGNSGGPLFTMDGKVVGINGRIGVRFFNRVNTGIGYAIPSNQIRRYLSRLKKGGRVWHGYIAGIYITDAGHPGFENSGRYGDGVLVIGVDEPSPAQEAGFEVGDMIVEIEGHRIFNSNRLHGVLGTFPQCETVTVKVRRGEKRDQLVELRVWLGDPTRWNRDGTEKKEQPESPEEPPSDPADPPEED